MQRVPDPYRVLGLGREATTAEIKAAHRRLAKRFHPDAPHAEASRFLAVQDAYELLRDPIRRREWDRKHAPGPVRAEPTTAGSRRHRTATADGTDTPEPPASPRSGRRKPTGTDATFGPNDRPPTSDHWTWTAEGVPWWEDGGSPKSRRTSRRRSKAGAGERPTGAPTGTSAGPAGPSHKTKATPEPATADVRSDVDVFSRSSGAAWSSASRAYFRRRAADMPSGAANPNTPRWTTPVGAPPPRRYEPASPQATATASPPAAAGSRQARTEPSPPSERPIGSSLSLGAALAALFRRGDR